MKILKIYSVLLLLMCSIVAAAPKVTQKTKRDISRMPHPKRALACACNSGGLTPCSGGTSCVGPIDTFCCVEIFNDQTVKGSLTAQCEIIEIDLTVGGEVDIAGNLLVEGTGNFVGDVLVENNFCDFANVTVDGSEKVQGSLTVNTQTIINGTAGSVIFTVNGNEQLNGSFTATGNESIGQNLSVGGNTVLNGTLTDDGTGTFNDDVLIEGSLIIGDDLTIGGNEVIQGSLTVNNGATVTGPSCVFTVNGPETINGTKTINGDHTVDQLFTVDGTSTFNNVLNAHNGLHIANGETIETGGLTILNGGATITSDVTVTGISTVDDLNVFGNLTESEDSFLNITNINGPLTTQGPVVMNKGLLLAGGHETLTSGNLTLNNGNLTVAGITTLTNTVTADNGAIIDNGLTVFGGQNIISGDLQLAACDDLVVIGAITVDQTITSPGLCTCKDLLINDALTNSTSADTGALIVDGGVGVGEDIWIGGALFFSNVITQGGTPSGLDYYEEACFTTTFFWGDSVSDPVNIQIVRIGKLVNLIVPLINFAPQGSPAPAVIQSSLTLPAQFIPFVTVRGASSTISSDFPALGEFEVNPLGFIIFGNAGSNGGNPAALGPQPVSAATGADLDPNTITYNILSCGCPY